MGTWGVGVFENDQALAELTADVTSARALGLSTINTSSDAIRMLVYGELFAAGSNAPGKLPEAAVEAALRVPEPVRRHVLQRIRGIRSDSELRDQWSDADRLDEWTAVVDDLIARLKGTLTDDADDDHEVRVSNSEEGLISAIETVSSWVAELHDLRHEIEYDPEETSVVLSAGEEEVEGPLYDGEFATGLAELLNELLEFLDAEGRFEGDDDEGVLTFET